MSTAAPPRLFLHVDVNKTVIVSDPVSGVSLEAMVNAIVSEAVYGTAEGDVWSSQTEATTERAAHVESGLVTYADWLDGRGLPRKERKQLKAVFTEPGAPGEGARAAFERLMAALVLPEAHRETMAALRPKLWAQGFAFLVPSFLNCVRELDAAGRDFTVVFRTFGIDTLEVQQEFNLFCEGRHPLYPGVRMDGTGETVDRRLVFPHSSGTIMRLSEGDEGVCLAMPGATNLVSISQGASGFIEALRAKSAQGHRAIGITDNYAFWARCGESDTSGKLLVQDPQSAATELHLLFDDNVEVDRAHIADVRTEAGDPVPFGQAMGRYVVKVEPMDAITDPEYFQRTLEGCERRALEWAAANPRPLEERRKRARSVS